MELKYDEVGDVLYISLSKSKIIDSHAIKPTIILDYDNEDEIVGIEVLNFSTSQLDLNEVIKLSKYELVARVSAQ